MSFEDLDSVVDGMLIVLSVEQDLLSDKTIFSPWDMLVFSRLVKDTDVETGVIEYQYKHSVKSLSDGLTDETYSADPVEVTAAIERMVEAGLLQWRSDKGFTSLYRCYWLSGLKEDKELMELFGPNGTFAGRGRIGRMLCDI